ncbi:MAG: hypothetical protein HQM10_06835 [Candidatus Riflebacteria bacterium]|nr:hypothetical protein [Candidatus Riflebacteria bacterium]
MIRYLKIIPEVFFWIINPAIIFESGNHLNTELVIRIEGIKMEIAYKNVLFCEDIRQEIGGRVSLMGILGSTIYVQYFPVLFPKFCLFVEWGEILGKHTVHLNIIPPAGVSLPAVKPSAEIRGQPGVIARSMIVLNSFVFPSQGTYFFEFYKGTDKIGREKMTIEKYEAPAGMAN